MTKKVIAKKAKAVGSCHSGNIHTDTVLEIYVIIITLIFKITTGIFNFINIIYYFILRQRKYRNYILISS